MSKALKHLSGDADWYPCGHRAEVRKRFRRTATIPPTTAADIVEVPDAAVMVWNLSKWLFSVEWELVCFLTWEIREGSLLRISQQRTGSSRREGTKEWQKLKLRNYCISRFYVRYWITNKKMMFQKKLWPLTCFRFPLGLLLQLLLRPCPWLHSEKNIETACIYKKLFAG